MKKIQETLVQKMTSKYLCYYRTAINKYTDTRRLNNMCVFVYVRDIYAVAIVTAAQCGGGGDGLGARERLEMQ